MEQTLWPPPSIPTCKKQKSGIGSIFVDKEALLPHSHRRPTGSGQIGAVGKVKIFEARHQKDGKGRNMVSKSSERETGTLTLTYLERDAASGTR